jgi:hypothetical protein
MSTNRNQKKTRSADEETIASVHQFKVGQTVRIKPGYREPFFPDQNYRIVANLPERNGSPQYRVRNSGEPHERVITHEKIVLLNEIARGKDRALLEKTFGDQS